MASILRFRKLCYVEQAVKCASVGFESFDQSPKIDQKLDKKEEEVISANNFALEIIKKRKQPRKQPKEWRRLDSCCWMIGYLCSTWWLLLFLYHSLPVTLLQVPESPGVRLKREGLAALHPVVLVPGIVTGGLELWEGQPCADGLFRKRLWGGSFTEIFKRPLCWLEHLSLHSETGLDPPGIRVRAVPGLVAADYFAPGYFVWAVLIENLAKIGYEGKNLHMAAYDWRLSFQNTEIRDHALSRLKSKIELMYLTNGYKKVAVVPHSMGVIYFLHFLKWVETPPPIGGGGGPGWCAKHIKAIMNIGPAFLGVPKAVSNIFSAEGKDIAYIRAMAPGLLDSKILGLQTLEHVMRVSRTWDSIVSLVPKGGETIWGNMDWSPEERHACDFSRKRHSQPSPIDNNVNNSDVKRGFRVKDPVQYGRIISFGKTASQLHSSQLPTIDSKEFLRTSASQNFNFSCGEAWTEYDEMSREGIQKVAANKAYTTQTLLDLLRFVAPKMMLRAEAHFSHGIADDLDNPKYNHYKYWSNPLEMKLPDAPDMEIYCLYGVGIPTERSYVYKLSPTSGCKSIPYQIDSSVNGEDGSCLKGGVYFADGDENVPVLSAGFMCAKGWRGRTRFNPSGIATYIREYRHKPPSSLLEGRGIESGAHVDIMGNVALIEDVLRIASGATGKEIRAENIGFTSYPPAYLSKQAEGKNLLIGANFASASSGYYETTAKLYHTLSLSKQLENYKEYQNKLVAIAGKSNASSIISGGIYLISSGSSDFLQNYYINPLLYKAYTPDQFSDILIESYAHFIQNLYGLGARKIGVTTLPPLGCLPAAITVFGSDSNKCVAKLNSNAVSFNNKLNATSQRLQKKLSGLNLVVFDIYQSLFNLVTKPAENGFAEARRACCGTGLLETSILCNPKSIGTCANASEYVFWDGFHPSEAANKILADDLLTSGISLIF
ncbi:GDSL lipase/esterase - like 10 [Theobroma cacao]|nr:GDSL lipase/esterase - like 10 [Theobroma cacao]